MGNSPSIDEKPKYCLIPPLIRRRHPRPICANEFLYLGKPTRELLSDWFYDSSTASADMILQPQIRVREDVKFDPEDIPEIRAFLKGSAQIPSDIHHIEPNSITRTATALVALEARFRNQIRGTVSMEGSESTHPQIYIGFGRENLKGTSFFVSLDPRKQSPHAAFGLTQAFEYGSLGISASASNVETIPNLAGWASLRPFPELALGVNARLDPVPNQQQYIASADFALNFRDPFALIYDRPAYEITLVAKDGGQSYHLSYFQHFVVRRRIMNPFEHDGTTHITNYIDVGADASVENNRLKFGIGGSWQFNKNNMLKFRLTQHNLQSTYVFKTWANPAVVLATTLGLNFKTGLPMYGLSLTCEGALGKPEYERAGIQYEELQVLKYGVEPAPAVTKYDMWSDDSPVLHHRPPPVRVVVPKEDETL